MKRASITGALCMIAFLGLPAGVLADRMDRLVDRLMVESGIHDQVGQYPALILAGMEDNEEESVPVSPEERAEMKRAVIKAFDADVLRTHIRAHIKSNLRETDIRKVLRWLASPLGARITRLEIDATTPEAHREMDTMADELMRDRGRVERMRRLDQAMLASETGYNLIVNSQTAMLVAMSAMMPSSRQPSYEEIRSWVERRVAQRIPEIEKDNLVGFLYVYRPLTNEEIDEYIRFAESRPGARYHAVISEGLNNALAEGARHLVDIIMGKFMEPH